MFINHLLTKFTFLQKKISTVYLIIVYIPILVLLALYYLSYKNIIKTEITEFKSAIIHSFESYDHIINLITAEVDKTTNVENFKFLNPSTYNIGKQKEYLRHIESIYLVNKDRSFISYQGKLLLPPLGNDLQFNLHDLRKTKHYISEGKLFVLKNMPPSSKNKYAVIIVNISELCKQISGQLHLNTYFQIDHNAYDTHSYEKLPYDDLVIISKPIDFLTSLGNLPKLEIAILTLTIVFQVIFTLISYFSMQLLIKSKLDELNQERKMLKRKNDHLRLCIKYKTELFTSPSLDNNLNEYSIYSILETCKYILYCDLEEKELICTINGKGSITLESTDYSVLITSILDLILISIQKSPSYAIINISIKYRDNSYFISIEDNGYNVDNNILYKKYANLAPLLNKRPALLKMSQYNGEIKYKPGQLKGNETLVILTKKQTYQHTQLDDNVIQLKFKN